MKNLTWQNPEPLGFAASRVEELFVAQVLIKKVKLKCCGIKVYYVKASDRPAQGTGFCDISNPQPHATYSLKIIVKKTKDR